MLPSLASSLPACSILLSFGLVAIPAASALSPIAPSQPRSEGARLMIRQFAVSNSTGDLPTPEGCEDQCGPVFQLAFHCTEGSTSDAGSDGPSEMSQAACLCTEKAFNGLIDCVLCAPAFFDTTRGNEKQYFDQATKVCAAVGHPVNVDISRLNGSGSGTTPSSSETTITATDGATATLSSVVPSTATGASEPSAPTSASPEAQDAGNGGNGDAQPRVVVAAAGSSGLGLILALLAWGVGAGYV